MWVAPCNHKGPYERQGVGSELEKAVYDMVLFRHGWGRQHQPRAADSPQRLEEAGSGYPHSFRGRAALLTIGFQPSETDFGLLTAKTAR